MMHASSPSALRHDPTKQGFGLPQTQQLGIQRGVLYFHLLLGRLVAGNEIGRESFERSLPDVQLDTHSAHDLDG
jgi:hypothetical protein